MVTPSELNNRTKKNEDKETRQLDEPIDFIEESSLIDTHSQSSDDGESIWLLSYADLMTLMFAFFVLLTSFSKLDLENFEKLRKETTHLFGGQYSKPFEDFKEKLKEQARLQGVADKAVFDDSEKGMTITFQGSVFFDSGSAELKPESIEMLTKVISVVKQQDSKFNVVVEGHTDDNSIQNEKFPSNWELSSYRASSVLHLFENMGFPRSQLRAIGFADTLPIAPNRNSDGQPVSLNQAQNRRIVIKLIKIN